MKKIIIFIMALVLVMASACTDTKNKPANVTEHEVTEKNDEKAELVLYYASDDAMGLKAEVRSVPKDEATNPENVVNMLISGTNEDGYASVIPNDTELNSCTVAGGVCTVDVSEEFVSRKGSANEQMIIYSVVNTLCRLDGIEKVKFLVDGKDVEFFGSYVFDEPFEEDTTLIKVGY